MNREISIQKQKKCFQLITFEVKNIHGLQTNMWIFKKSEWRSILEKNQNGENVLEKK